MYEAKNYSCWDIDGKTWVDRNKTGLRFKKPWWLQQQTWCVHKYVIIIQCRVQPCWRWILTFISSCTILYKVIFNGLTRTNKSTSDCIWCINKIWFPKMSYKSVCSFWWTERVVISLHTPYVKPKNNQTRIFSVFNNWIRTSSRRISISKRDSWAQTETNTN